MFLTSIILLCVPFSKAEMDLQPWNTHNTDQKINMSLTPEQPAPEQDVKIKLGRAKINVSVSQITWYVDNNKEKEGLGEKEISVKAKGLGQITRIKAVVVAKDGSTFEILKTIIPKRLSIRIEPILNASPQQAKVIAVAEVIDPLTGKMMLAEDLFYKWSFNNTVAGKLSGLGKDSIVWKSDYFIDKYIEVVVKTADGKTIFHTTEKFNEKQIRSLFDLKNTANEKH